MSEGTRKVRKEDGWKERGDDATNREVWFWMNVRDTTSFAVAACAGEVSGTEEARTLEHLQ